MLEFVCKFWVQTALSFIVALIVTVSKLMLNRFKKEFAEQKYIKTGLIALLHDRLYQACNWHLAQGKITVAQLNNLEHLYLGYQGLGGNGTGTELFNRCKALPIEAEV